MNKMRRRKQRSRRRFGAWLARHFEQVILREFGEGTIYYDDASMSRLVGAITNGVDAISKDGP